MPGESHGRALMGILSGIPARFEVDIEKINFDLALRQKGFGRGERMKIEKDQVEIIAGIINGKTTGAPIGLLIKK